jgi:CBS domain-containing protein
MICPSCHHANLPGSEQCSNCLHDLTALDRPVAHDRVERSLMDDCVRTLAPKPAVTLPPDATVGEAMRLMLERNFGAVPVVDGGRLVGIFSERDVLLRVAGTKDYAGRPLAEYMTATPETIREDDSLAFVLHKMDSGGYRHLPVVRDGQVVGMISVRDLLRHITRLCEPSCMPSI